MGKVYLIHVLYKLFSKGWDALERDVEVNCDEDW